MGTRFRWHHFRPPRSTLTPHRGGRIGGDNLGIPKLGILKTPPSNYGQTAADGATLWIDRRGEVIVVANAPVVSWLALLIFSPSACDGYVTNLKSGRHLSSLLDSFIGRQSMPMNQHSFELMPSDDGRRCFQFRCHNSILRSQELAGFLMSISTTTITNQSELNRYEFGSYRRR